MYSCHSEAITLGTLEGLAEFLFAITKAIAKVYVQSTMPSTRFMVKNLLRYMSNG
jgi:hypothetical protein